MSGAISVGIRLDSRPLTGAVAYWAFPVPAAVFSEQFHARTAPNNATRLSGMEWLWWAKRA